MNDNIQVVNKERKEWIINQLFLSMGFLDLDTRRPFRMLSEFQFESGNNICGSEFIGCALSAYYTPDEDYYIGENKVSISYDITNEEVIMEEQEFYPYVEQYSMEYVKNNPDFKDEVEECLRNIKKRFKVE
ncbi:ribonuclease toxin immunity protein CdiI [Paenibacillus durus]|uniref:CDI immunity protein domain-containing protein n=1 Tax=Paenibacillus durus ATCC 35681 TaxID=1333534 RepID=A0A0F7CGY6_PAEDU|nr:ribonuclease toxin immunity protein CdiI [Paenibacillus durus]AKG33340.1 hypothetical protein VK70_00870 [Paenibacillus durus ATCC 35681]